MVVATAKLFVLPRSSSNDNFEWLHKTEIWQCLTDLDKKRQGPTIYLSLNHNERPVVILRQRISTELMVLIF